MLTIGGMSWTYLQEGSFGGKEWGMLEFGKAQLPGMEQLLTAGCAENRPVLNPLCE
jgi:hypothetical protein